MGSRRRRVRVEFAGVIFAALLFVLLVGLIEILDPVRPVSMALPDGDPVEASAVESPADAPEEQDCMQSEAEFAAKLDQSRSCTVDADCALARLQCPFECVTSVSTSALDDLKRDEMSYQQACHRCESECPETLTKWRAACVRQRCIVLDRSIEELQEETLRHVDEAVRLPREN